MNRDFESAAWAQSHHKLSDAISYMIDKVAFAFERLAAIEYDAPWERVRN
ncbi:MAG: hypothetical protein KF730_06935 [Sphingomonas sp.]|nr:hypothetical protein [Sphingomonas sp.]MBX3564295.1 hypothetical protein [Sphingomonas sp.]